MVLGPKGNAWSVFGDVRRAIMTVEPHLRPKRSYGPDRLLPSSDFLFVWLDACLETGAVVFRDDTPSLDSAWFVKEVIARSLLLDDDDYLDVRGRWPDFEFVVTAVDDGPPEPRWQPSGEFEMIGLALNSRIDPSGEVLYEHTFEADAMIVRWIIPAPLAEHVLIHEILVNGRHALAEDSGLPSTRMTRSNAHQPSVFVQKGDTLSLNILNVSDIPIMFSMNLGIYALQANSGEMPRVKFRSPRLWKSSR